MAAKKISLGNFSMKLAGCGSKTPSKIEYDLSPFLRAFDANEDDFKRNLDRFVKNLDDKIRVRTDVGETQKVVSGIETIVNLIRSKDKSVGRLQKRRAGGLFVDMGVGLPYEATICLVNERGEVNVTPRELFEVVAGTVHEINRMRIAFNKQ